MATRTRTKPGAALTVTCPDCQAITTEPQCGRCGHDFTGGSIVTMPPPNGAAQSMERASQEDEAMERVHVPEPSSEVPDEPELSEAPPPSDFPQEPRKRGRFSRKAQHSMAETAITNGELEPLLTRRAELIEAVEPDEETKALAKELSQTMKRLKQVVVGMDLADGLYRVAGTGWLLDVTNRPGGTKAVTFGASVDLKVAGME